MILHLTLSLGAIFLTHWLGGIAAFGSSLLALPLLLTVGWELRPAIATLLCVGTVQSVYMAFLTGRDADRPALLRIMILAGIGIPVGFLFAGFLPQRLLQITLGLVLAAAGASRMIERRVGSEWSPPRWALRSMLVAGGVIHGAFGSGGATLTVYARYALRTKEAFRGTLPIMWALLNTVVLVGLGLEGQIGRSVLTAAVPGAPIVLIATWLGHRAASRLSQERFANVVALLLCAAGALTVARNLV